MGVRAALFLAFLAAVPAPGRSDQPSPFPEFEAKRVKPPKAGSGPRITVQIDPEEVPQPAAAPPAVPAPAPPAAVPDTRYSWFWANIAERQEAAGPGRLNAALQALQQGSVAAAAPMTWCLLFPCRCW